MGNYVIKKTANGEYFFNLLADNFQIILTSPVYTSKSSCFNSIDLIRNCCLFDSYEHKQTDDNKHYFILKASDGQIVGNSELYDSKTSLETAIASVRKNGTNKKAIEEEPYF